MVAMKKVNTNVALVTFGLFMTEALLHYNLGVKSQKTEKQSSLKLPPNKDLIRLAITVGIFSVLNGMIIGQLTKT